MEPKLKLDQLKSTKCKFIDMESLVRTSFIPRRWLLRRGSDCLVAVPQITSVLYIVGLKTSGKFISGDNLSVS